MSSITLYGFWRSSSSQRVSIALALKGLPWTWESIDLSAREQEGEAYRAVNPWGQVPALRCDERVVTQSLAILDFLEDRFPETRRLLPEDPWQRAAVREITEFVASMIQPFQLPGATRRRMIDAFSLDRLAEGADAACAAFSREHVTIALGELDRLVARQAGLFAVGDAPSLADCCVIPQLWSASALGVDVNVFPALSKLYERCMRVEAFASSHPSQLQQRTAAGAAPTAAASGALGQAVRTAVESHALRYKEHDEAVTHYLSHVANRPIPELDRVRSVTFEQFGPIATKVSAVDVCLFLRWIVGLLKPRRLVEIGVFTGSSSLAILDAMQPDARLMAFDVSDEYTRIARDAWARAGVSHQVELRLVDAAVGVPALAGDPDWAGQIDFAWIDGLNTQYRTNLDQLLPLLAPGAWMVFDNTLWKGRVAQPDVHDDQTDHLRDLNAWLHASPDFECTVLGVGDGLTLVRRTMTR
ncbi:MAG: maleylacetoacetate isomerase [Myxococcales bacterium]|nr:maleylacetoacetate isomerase [Myxococcales bacterium]